MIGVQSTGVGTYARGLQQAMPLITPRCAILHATSHADSSLRRTFAALRPGARTARGAVGQDGDTMLTFHARDVYRRAHVHFSIYGSLLRVRLPGPAGVMHWTYPVPMMVEGWTNIYTVHDLIPLTHPNLAQVSAARLEATLRQISQVAARIVTVSTAAAQELSKSSLLQGVKIVDAGQLVAPARSAPGPLGFGLSPGKYVIFCGSHEPRKNLARLLEAYASSGITLPLVLTGPDGWDSSPLRHEIASMPNVVPLPYQSRESLTALMANARALVAPSLAEGFGLPLAEAMVLGVPTVASNIPSHREIAQGASILVDPHCVASIASGLARVANDDALAAGLIVRGRESASRYGLASFAGRLSAVYEAAFAERGVST